MANIVNGLMPQLTMSVSRTGLGLLPAPVDLHHDRVHHEEQRDGYWDGHDRRIVDVNGHAIECLGDAGRDLAQNNAAEDAKPYPEGEVLFEDVQLLGGRFGCHGCAVSPVGQRVKSVYGCPVNQVSELYRRLAN